MSAIKEGDIITNTANIHQSEERVVKCNVVRLQIHCRLHSLNLISIFNFGKNRFVSCFQILKTQFSTKFMK